MNKNIVSEAECFAYYGKNYYGNDDAWKKDALHASFGIRNVRDSRSRIIAMAEEQVLVKKIEGVIWAMKENTFRTHCVL